MKLKYKFTWVFLIAIVFLLVLSLFSLQQTVSVYNNQLYDTLMVSTELATNTGDQRIQAIVEDSYNIVTNHEFQEQFMAINKSENYVSYELSSLIMNKLYKYLYNPDVMSIHLLFNNGEDTTVTKDILRLPQALLEDIHKNTDRLKGDIYWIEPSEETQNTIILARQIRQIKNLSLEPLGIVIFRINPEKIVQGATRKILGNQVLLLSDRDYIYKGENRFTFEEVRPNKNELKSYSIKNIGPHKYFFIYHQSRYNNWIYASYIQYDTLFNSTRRTVRIYICLYLGVGICLIFIINGVVRSLLKPVEILTNRMRKVESGDFHQEIEQGYLIELRKGNEVDHLEYDFYLMLDKINHLIDENYIKQLQVKKFQIKALQAQINPHFLYNTLNSIFWIAKVNNQQDISVMIKSLANLLRKSIDESNQLLTVQEELDLLMDYINIQKIRHKERLHIEINVSEDILNDQIPKLTLQPLVENAINYGLEKEVRDCIIDIKGYKEKGYIYITIEDNGMGMTEETTDQLNKGLIKPQGTGIGVRNIKERLNNVFEGNCGLSFRSESNKGTIATIKIPKSKNNHMG